MVWYRLRAGLADRAAARLRRARRRWRASAPACGSPRSTSSTATSATSFRSSCSSGSTSRRSAFQLAVVPGRVAAALLRSTRWSASSTASAGACSAARASSTAGLSAQPRASSRFFLWLGIRHFRRIEAQLRRPDLSHDADVVIRVEGSARNTSSAIRRERERYTALRDVIGARSSRACCAQGRRPAARPRRS